MIIRNSHSNSQPAINWNTNKQVRWHEKREWLKFGKWRAFVSMRDSATCFRKVVLGTTTKIETCVYGTYQVMRFMIHSIFLWVKSCAIKANSTFTRLHLFICPWTLRSDLCAFLLNFLGSSPIVIDGGTSREKSKFGSRKHITILLIKLKIKMRQSEIEI